MDIWATALGRFVQELAADNQEPREAERKRSHEEKFWEDNAHGLYRQQGSAARIFRVGYLDKTGKGRDCVVYKQFRRFEDS